MKIRVLGNAGAELPNFNLSALLVDGTILLDAGTIGAVLNTDEQSRLKAILITHAHHDHIRAIPALAENLAISTTRTSLALVSTKEILATIRGHIFNNVIWPDFTKIPSHDPVLNCSEIIPETRMSLHGYSLEAFHVNHTVPAVGYKVRKDGQVLLYTGDTGPTDRIWDAADDVTSLIVEVSFPNRLQRQALETGHLTAALLKNELEKMKKAPPLVYATHLKPQYREEIMADLGNLNLWNVALLEDGITYSL